MTAAGVFGLPGQRVQCSATSTRTGEQCRRFAVIGARVCPTHGGRAPQVRAAAARRRSLAEQLDQAPRRSASQVLLDAMHTADVLALHVRESLPASPDPDQTQALLDAYGRAAMLAKVALESKVEHRAEHDMAEVGQKIAAVFERLLEALHMSEDPAVRGAVAVAMRSLSGTPQQVPDLSYSVIQAAARVQGIGPVQGGRVLKALEVGDDA